VILQGLLRYPMHMAAAADCSQSATVNARMLGTTVDDITLPGCSNLESLAGDERFAERAIN